MEEESGRSDASHEGSPELHDERGGPQQEYSLQEERDHRRPVMDEEDVLEMSVLAAEIESAEDFNLTFETVDTSAVEEEEVRPKSRQPKKKPSPLYKSDAEGIEEFLEEGMLNQSSSTSSEEIANVSVADSLLVEWGSPDRSHLSSARRMPRKAAVEDIIQSSTPKTRGPLKVLTPLFSNGRTAMTSKKRSSTSSNEDDQCSPARKKQPGTPSEKPTPRARTASQLSATFKTPSRPSVKSAVRSAPKQPLKTQNK